MIAYFGPPGSFTHEIALKRFGERTRLEAESTVGEVFESVESAESTTGIVPVYNSTGGFVNDTLDELLRADFVRSGCRIAEELKMDIQLCLIGRGKPRSVRRIYTHPIPLKHSRSWVTRHHPHAELLPITSTSEAARRARADKDTAAIASEAAAFRYGLRVWDRVRGERKKNVTQFIVFGKQEPGTVIDPRTTIGFGLAHRPGTLAGVLTELARAKLNLTRIVSRPFPGKAGEYVFLVEFEGDSRVAHTQAALKAVKHATTFLRVLGTYPAARQVS